MIKIYLGSKISGLSFDDMNTWRVKAKQLFSDDNVNAINPVEFYNFEMIKQADNRARITPKEIMRFDLWLVENADLILVNLNHQGSIGTAIEVYRASQLGIPVIGFGTVENHEWVECCVDTRFDTLEEAIEHIKIFYLPNI